MVVFCINNIYVEFGGHVYQQTVGIPMGTNCAPLLADLFLYSYLADLVHHLQITSRNKAKHSLISFCALQMMFYH